MRNDASYLIPLDDEYETCERTIAELRIYGYDLEPEVVTARFGIQPSRTQKRGETWVGFRGCVSQYKIGGWFLSSEGQVQSKDIRHHLNWLLEKLLPAKQEILRLQISYGISMTVYCIWWSRFGCGGPALWPQQMRLLADLNLECGFDFSFFGDDEPCVIGHD